MNTGFWYSALYTAVMVALMTFYGLMWAAGGNHPDIVDLLLARAAPVRLAA